MLKLAFVGLIFIICQLFFACVIGFSNAQNHVSGLYSKVYIPAANDSSIYSGNSSRLTFAIRDALANRTDIMLTSLDEARIALQINITDRRQSIVSVDNCINPGTPSVASTAFLCADIHPDITPGGNPQLPVSFNQPSVSPSSESLSLIVNVKAIDLNNGKILWAKQYTAKNSPSVSFNELGNINNYNMSSKPDMHGLRYQEAVDNAVRSVSISIASDIQGALFQSLPSE